MKTTDPFICGLGPGSLIPTPHYFPLASIGHRARSEVMSQVEGGALECPGDWVGSRR